MANISDTCPIPPAEEERLPRLAEVVGVDVEERFKNSTCDVEMWIDANGDVQADSERENLKNVNLHYLVCDIINNPDYLIRIPNLTDDEIAICKSTYAAWVTMNSNGECVRLWDEKPEFSGGYYTGSDFWIADFDPAYFPSIKPLDCVHVGVCEI